MAHIIVWIFDSKEEAEAKVQGEAPGAVKIGPTELGRVLVEEFSDVNSASQKYRGTFKGKWGVALLS